MGLPPLLVGTRPSKQKLDGVASGAPRGGGWRVEGVRRLVAGGSRRLALQPGLEVWPVFLQLLVVSGNCKELWGERGSH